MGNSSSILLGEFFTSLQYGDLQNSNEAAGASNHTALFWVGTTSLALIIVGSVVKQHLRWRADFSNMYKLGIPFIKEHKWNGMIYSWSGSATATIENYHQVYDYRKQLHDKYGKTFVWIPHIWLRHLTVSTIDPAVVKHILYDKFNVYLKTDILKDTLSDLLGDGIFGANHGKHAIDGGHAWYFQRKTAAKIFSKNKFEGHVHRTLVSNAKKLCRNIEVQITSSSPSILLQAEFYKFTLDTIGDIGFGVDLDTLSQKRIPFADAFDIVQKLMVKRQYNFGWKYLKFLYPSEQEIEKELAILDDFCYNIISNRLAVDDDKLAEKGDILSLFIQADHNLSKKYLRDIIMSFFIAGRDTTACTLSFTFLILAQYPEIQEKLFQEIVSNTQEGDSFVTLEHLKGMKYLDGVVKESLRLFPPVPLDSKQAAEDNILPDGTWIPKGTRIMFEIYCMGRSKDLWENPEAVIPERWFDRKRTPYEFPVFQAGNRICLGRDLALYEIKFATFELLRRYRFELMEPVPSTPYLPGITMTVKNGLNLKVHKRY